MVVERKGTTPKTQRLKRGGIGLFVMTIVMIASFSFAAQPTRWITITTFTPYYSPTVVQIGVGTSISWENPTTTVHSITHDGCNGGERCAFDSGALGPNGTFTVPHLQPGSYSYHCVYHPIMRGVIVVSESDPPNEI